MSGLKKLVLGVGLVCSVGSTVRATEPFVQDFDGWKITIRPGVSSIPDPVPAGARLELAATPKSLVQLVSLRQQEVPPAPEGDKPTIAPATGKAAPAPQADGLPVIIPGESDWCCDNKATVSPPEGSVDPRYLSQMYYEIYKSIPFIRAEYDANRSYLHDTTVEFLFGKMRPTVLHRGTTVIRHEYPYDYGVPWAYGGPGYDYPRLQLVVPGTGLRVHHLN